MISSFKNKRNNIVLTFKGFLFEMAYKKLTAGELLKPGREGRGETIITKIQDGDPFLLMTGKTVKFKKDEEVLKAVRKALEDRDNSVLNNMEFAGEDGKFYKLNQIAKSPEFGGKGAGSGTRAEDAALSAFKKELQGVFDKETVPYIYLQIGKRTEKVASIESTPGTPKSDFHMMDEAGNEVFWISHKKGSRANDFQQYGGMPELKNEKSRDMMAFVDAVNKELELLGSTGKFPMKTAFARPVKDKNIQLKTLYGKEFKAGSASSRQNIDVLYQGPMKLKKTGTKNDIPVYTIVSNHTELHGTVPRGDYEPWYYVRPEQAKKQFGIPGARFFIVAKATATKNRNTKII